MFARLPDAAGEGVAMAIDGAPGMRIVTRRGAGS
jgi:hypothetical protein